jgi:hypothetical protein
MNLNLGYPPTHGYLGADVDPLENQQPQQTDLSQFVVSGSRNEFHCTLQFYSSTVLLWRQTTSVFRHRHMERCGFLESDYP